MILSPQQDRAYKEVKNWLGDSHRKPFFYLGGYAGTGKTTLARILAGSLYTRYVAFTGKAASVMRRKGCVGAQTIHSLIYKPKGQSYKRLIEIQTELKQLRDKENPSVEELQRIQILIKEEELERLNSGRVGFDLNSESDLIGAQLCVLDEGSMVDSTMAEDLLSFGVPILVLGDPAQLPPVFGAGYFTSHQPDFMLTEVHRQALDSPVLRLATLVRTEHRWKDFGDDARLIARADPELALSADQLLVGRNATRRASNARMRELLGFEGRYPVVKDRLVCLRNNHDLGILNGEIFLATDDAEDVDPYVNLRLRRELEENSVFCSAHKLYFLGREKELSPWDQRDAEAFDYGYALTVHKAQGSEWNDVIYFGNDWPGDNYWAHAYTAVTRAAERITVVGVNE